MGPARLVAVLSVLLEQTREHWREQVLAIKEGRMDFNTHQTKKQCSEKGLHCWTPPTQRFDIGGTGGRHTQPCAVRSAFGTVSASAPSSIGASCACPKLGKPGMHCAVASEDHLPAQLVDEGYLFSTV